VRDVIEVAWQSYDEYRKSPRKRKAGPGFADPEFELPVEWLEPASGSSRRRRAAEAADALAHPARLRRRAHRPDLPGRDVEDIPARADWRRRIEQAGVTCDLLDLSALTAEYGRQILPCKACVSTAMPLCHWPCSCYPNHAMGQVNDWMNELYPRWVAAHGVMIVTPCLLVPGAERAEADDGPARLRRRRQPGSDDHARQEARGGQGARAEGLALSEAPRRPRLLGRRARRRRRHRDARARAHRMADRHAPRARVAAPSSRYVGYYEPYATSHDSLDKDEAFQTETRNAARTLVEAVALSRRGALPQPGDRLEEPRSEVAAASTATLH
jgi:hypothetical protein